MKTEDEYWIAIACDGDIQPGTIGYLAKRLITTKEAIEIYEQNEE